VTRWLHPESTSFPRALALGAVALAAVLACPSSSLAAGLPATLTVVGHDDLGARGLNAGLALADHCAFVGSRGQGPVAIEDISDPAHPRGVGSLPGRARSTAREVRAVPASHLLVVLSYQLGGGGGNRIDLYQWTTDCTQPSLAGSHDFGRRPPHELFLWRQPGGGRTLLFVTMFSGGAGDLQVIDASDPSHPALSGTWSPPRGLLHSISLSDDGRRAFLSLWTGGMLVADVSQFTGGSPNPQLTLLTPAASALPPLPGGNVHSAVQLPGRDLVVITDERYPPACPYGPARLVDVSDPAHLRVVATLAAPENDPATCRGAVTGTYTSHNPTIVGDLAFVTWYSSGLQVFDVSSPAQPARLAEFRAQGITPGALDPQLGVTPTMTWTYPIVRDGLIYVADINQGLYVLRYSGPHQEQVAQVAFAEGNSNLTATLAATPGPSLRPGLAPGSPVRSGTHAAAQLSPHPTSAVIAIVVGLLLVTGGAVAVTRRRRRRT
jgi:hypothetical protein